MSFVNTTGNAGGCRRTASLPSSSSFTVCMWAYCVTDNNTGQHFYNYDNGSDQGLEGQFNTGTNTIDIWDGRAGTITAFGSNPSPFTGAWVFFAQRSNGTSGVQSRWATLDSPTFATHTTGGSGAFGTLTDLTFALGIFSEAFDGRVAHPRAWDAELTDDELYLEMYSSLPVRLTNLNFAFRDISTSSITDIGPNARNATVNGSPTLAEDPPAANDIMWCPQFSHGVLQGPAAPPLRILRANPGIALMGNPGRYLRAA